MESQFGIRHILRLVFHWFQPKRPEVSQMERICCIYMRVSTDMQTVDSQLHALKEYCFRNKVDKYEMFIDEGIGGAVENRPSLNRLLAMIERGECDQLLTFSFSRSARSTSHLLKILQKCNENKMHLVSITEQIDTNSPMGMALLGALSQLERELIKERVKAGLAAAKLKGKQIGRKKLRSSVLIRSLFKSGLSFRKIAVIAQVLARFDIGRKTGHVAIRGGATREN